MHAPPLTVAEERDHVAARRLDALFSRGADRGALALLFQQLEQVGPMEREAFVLHWLSELSMREIARLQGVATTTVSARIGRAAAWAAN